MGNKCIWCGDEIPPEEETSTLIGLGKDYFLVHLSGCLEAYLKHLSKGNGYGGGETRINDMHLRPRRV